MADTLQPPLRPTYSLMAILTGAGIALVIVFLFQLWVKDGPPGDVIPYEEVARPYARKHMRAEFTGLLIGIFAGSVLANIIFSRPEIARGLCMAFVTIAIIALSPWTFTLPKEIIVLALPLWMVAGLVGFYCGRLLKRKDHRPHPGK